MTEDEILEGNKLIAKFMDMPITRYSEFYFNDKWDWLMPSIERVEEISELSQNRKCNFHVTIEKHRCFIKWGIGYTICDINDYRNSKISIVYKAVIEFIKWYNQNKKN